MYCFYKSKVEVRDNFRRRVWRVDEAFRDYVQDKMILTNLVPLCDKFELIDYIIAGIPDASLRDHASLQNFRSVEKVINAFRNISLRNKRRVVSDSARTSVNVAPRGE